MMPSHVEDLLSECYRSTKVFAKTLMPERFSGEFSHVIHDPIFDLIDSGAPRIAIAAPRGSGKTSICLAKSAKDILFRDIMYLMWVSVSHDGASSQSENLKRELASNQEIKKLFGPLKAKSTTEMDESFSKKSWVAYDNTLVMPRGCGQQIRGALFGSARPDRFIIDDLEHPEEIRSEELRNQRKVWFWADLMKAMSRYKKDWQVIYIDTLKHEDSLLQDLLDSPDWESVRLEICDDEIKTLAPEIVSQEDLTTEYESHRDKGQLDIFYREYRNLPTSTEDASFKQNMFRYYEEHNLGDYSPLENVVIVDPAKTVKMISADSAIVGIGISQKSGALLVRDIDAGKFYPDDLYNRTIQMCQRLGAHTLAGEVTSLNEFITQPFKNELSRQGLYNITFIELKARGGVNAASKEQRIRGLVPYYRQGLIYHNATCSAALEAQLLSFPRAKRFDIMDATAYIIELLDFGGIYFDPVNTVEDDDLDSDPAFLEMLESNEQPVQDWRIF